MIDNYKQIRELLKFPTENSFYFLEIIKRRKENPEMDRHQRLIKDFYIFSLEEFDKLEEEVKLLCQEHNARAYFRLNLRDAEKVAFLFNERLAKLLTTKDYKSVGRSYSSVVGEFHQDPDKTWVVDCDTTNEIEVSPIRELINNLSTHEVPIKAELPTPNGKHLIARPFRLDTFRNQFPDVDVHKDNPCVLYMA